MNLKCTFQAGVGKLNSKES